MSNVNDILIRIATGRAQAARDAAATLDQTLATVEGMVREMRPTPEPVTIEGGNTADLADAEDMRSLLMEQGQEPSAAGLAEFIRFARMGEDEKDEAKKEAEAARERLTYITSGDPAATLAELVSTVGEALADAQNAQDRLAGGDVSIVQAQKTIAAALGTSPLNRLDCLASDVTETMSALRRALGCPDGASAGQIVAEANAAVDALNNAIAEQSELRAERNRLAGDLSIITAECARIDRAIAPLWIGDPSDCIGKRVEAVAKAAHVRAETVDSLYDKLRERDAQIAALTPGPWRTVAEEAPPRGETVAIVNNGDGAAFAYVTEIPSTGTADWVKLWRRIPAGLLDVPAPTVAP